ncbi:MAG: class I SAM-dependent methyltransferase [Actinomycetota bacterium]|nr:class I SAM-dependent methyltransferase [Actinomycetota bacterium]
MAPVSEQWKRWRSEVDLDEYETRWSRLAESGQDVFGEADFVSRFEPKSALDAGCGMGRVGIELAHRGVDVVGVDLDPDLLTRAAAAAPDVCWVNADLASLDLARTFDVVVLAGNVIPFVADSDRPLVVARCAAHVRQGGMLIAGFSLRPDWPGADAYRRWCDAAGLDLVEAHGAWDSWKAADGRLPGEDGDFTTGADYAVFVHRRP